MLKYQYTVIMREHCGSEVDFCIYRRRMNSTVQYVQYSTRVLLETSAIIHRIYMMRGLRRSNDRTLLSKIRPTMSCFPNVDRSSERMDDDDDDGDATHHIDKG